MARSTFEQAGEDLAFESIIRAGTLDMWLDHVGMYVDEFKLHITPDGYHTRVVDPANVGMTETALDKQAFESHRAGADGNGTLVVGLAIDRLQDVIGLVSNDELVSIGFDDETRMLHLRAGEINQSIALIDPDTIRQEPDFPELDLPTRVDLEVGSLRRAIKACGLTSDQISVGFYDGESEHRNWGLFFSAEGDTDDTLVDPDETKQEVHEHGETDTILSMSYVEEMEKVLPKSGEVQIRVGKEFPIKFDFVDGGDEETIETTVMLAPRIQSE
ncbi:beta clamp domain-containing protein [Halalkalicoccus jeotgali]|uniref:DNA polymerase sliding clamp n=1 Tax=Halalkalicoccus jeotgali (strain DSM 18796 / CECT 7217 / JCM 14584 / KCTC 4019 / B3) TaxID=795797 RepID=D8J9M2_HALJB|nr:hypothetical protein [Halalkalicoccus jeotgali]ADJ14434.1 Proliferating cell nuclear antigen, PCNA [Halalkalicoccus jeotgali B3]ELY40150.1 DNA polymerase sliding clamp [Halalkalicoccus jeotgali B3]